MKDDVTAQDEVAHGATLQRLQAKKSYHDPENILRLHHNGRPLVSA